MKELQCLLLNNGKVAVGFVEETEKTYTVEGFYIYAILGESTSSNADVRGDLRFEPFSPVGGMVSTLRIPKANVAGFQELPDHLVFNIRHVISAESRNLKMKKRMESVRVPGRTGMSPEEALSLVNKQIEESGKLPQKQHGVQSMGGVAGVFDVKPTSPYRDE